MTLEESQVIRESILKLATETIKAQNAQIRELLACIDQLRVEIKILKGEQ